PDGAGERRQRDRDRDEHGDLQGGAEDRGVQPVERGGRERRRHRPHRDESASGDGGAGGEDRYVHGAARVDRVEHADRPPVPGADRGSDGEDQRDDGGRHVGQRDEPVGDAAATGDGVHAGDGPGGDGADHHGDEHGRGDAGDGRWRDDRRTHRRHGDIAARGGADRRPDGAGEHHQRGRHGGERGDLQGGAEDHELRAVGGGGRDDHRDPGERHQSTRGDGRAGGEGGDVHDTAGIDRVEHADGAALPRADRGGDREDQRDDGGRHVCQRDGPDGDAAAAGDGVHPGDRSGGDGADDHGDEPDGGDTGDVHRRGDGGTDGGDGDVTARGGTGRRPDGAGEHHQRDRHGGERGGLQDATEDHRLHAGHRVAGQRGDRGWDQLQE